MRSLYMTLPALDLACAAGQKGPGAVPVIDDIEVRGNRRVPVETILYHLESKRSDPYDPARARRDFEAVLALGFFDPMRSRLREAPGPHGGVVIVFDLGEYPIIRDLQYE